MLTSDQLLKDKIESLGLSECNSVNKMLTSDPLLKDIIDFQVYIKLATTKGDSTFMV